MEKLEKEKENTIAEKEDLNKEKNKIKRNIKSLEKMKLTEENT
jgi:hypothetical protein